MNHQKIVEDDEEARKLPTISELELLTKEVIEDYTEREIEQLVKLQKRMDSFGYAPCDSQGGLKPDDGTDPLFYYQSNLVPILNVLHRKLKRDIDDDEGEEQDGLSMLQVREGQKVSLDMLRIAAKNNSQVNDERSRAKLLKNFQTTMETFCRSGKSFDTIVDLVNENRALMQDDSTEMVDGSGEAEDQVPMYQRMLKHRRQQSNCLKHLVLSLFQKFEDSIAAAKDQTVHVAAEAAQNQANAQHKAMSSLQKQLANMKREQEYLYFRVYGANHQRDPKAEKQKKYRRDVDEAYKSMVEAEVARRLVKAVKNSDALVIKVRADLEDCRNMMHKCHVKMANVLAPARTAMKANRRYEEHLLSLHDDHLYNKYAQQSSTSLTKRITNSELLALEAAGGKKNSNPLAHGNHGLRLDAPQDEQILEEVLGEAQRDLRNKVDTIARTVVDHIATKHVSPDAVKAYCSAVSEVGLVLHDTYKTTLESVMTTAQLLPPGVRPTLARNFAVQIGGKLAEMTSTTLPTFVKHLLENRDVNYIAANVQRVLKTTGIQPMKQPSNDEETQTEGEWAGKMGRPRSRSIASERSYRYGDEDDRATTNSEYQDSEYYYEEVEEDDEDSLYSATPGARSFTGSMLGRQPSKKNLQLDRRPTLLNRESSRERDNGTPNSGATTPIDGTKKPASSGKKTLKKVVRKLVKKPAGADPTKKSSVGSFSDSFSPKRVASPKNNDRKVNVLKDPKPAIKDDSGAVRKRRESVTFPDNTEDADPPMTPKSEAPLPRSVGTDSLDLSTPLTSARGSVVAQPVVETVSKKTQTSSTKTNSIGIQVFTPAAANDKTTSEDDRSKSDRGKLQKQNSKASPSGSTLAASKDLLTAPAVGSPKKPDDKKGSTAGANSGSSSSVGKYTFPTGKCTFVFLGVDGASVFWQRCAEVMPTMMEAFMQTVRDGLALFSGFEARTQGDALMAVFKDPIKATSFALWLQHQTLQLPYPRNILNMPNGIEVVGGDGTVAWRGFRIRTGIHIGEASITVKDDNPLYTGSVVTFASRMAIFACGGQVVVSQALSQAIAAKMSDLPGAQIRPQGECKGEHGTEPLFDIVDSLISMRHLHYDLNEAAAHAGILYQWQVTYAAQHDFSIHERMAFVFLEIESEVDHLNVDPDLTNSATKLVANESRRLAAKYNGKETRSRGPSSVLVFNSATRSVQFAAALQSRAMNLAYSDALMERPEFASIQDDEGNQIFGGLKLRMSIHFARPSSTAVNRLTNELEYYGSEITKGVALASGTKFGETLLTDETYQEVKEDLPQLEPCPVIKTVGARALGKDTVGTVYALFNPSLQARQTILQAHQEEPRAVQGLHRPTSAAGSEVSDAFRTPETMALTGAEALGPDGEREFNMNHNGEMSVVVVTLDQAAELLEAMSEQLEVAMNQSLSLIKELVKTSTGYLTSIEGITSTAIFRTPADAVEFATDLHRKLMMVPFSDEVLDFCETRLADNPNTYLFNGLRFKVAVHSGAVHEFYTGVLAERKRSFYGTALNQATYLSTNFSCGGEIVMTERFFNDLVNDPNGQSFLETAGVSTYKMESTMIPGDLARTPLFGLIEEELSGRRKYFFRGNHNQVGAIGGEGGVEGGGRAVIDQVVLKMRNAKFAFGNEGWYIANQAALNAFAPPPDDAEEGSSVSVHRLNAQHLQRLYRMIWQAADKCGRVMGYPADIDEDPFAFDAPLREAIVADYGGAEDGLMSAESRVLLRLHEMTKDMTVALGCRTDKGVFKHHTQQTVIFIPPDAKREDQLYKKVDIGAGKRVTVSTDTGGRGGGADTALNATLGSRKEVGSEGYRAGISSSLVASRLQEKRIMALENEVEDLRGRIAMPHSSGFLGSQIVSVSSETQLVEENQMSEKQLRDIQQQFGNSRALSTVEPHSRHELISSAPDQSGVGAESRALKLRDISSSQSVRRATTPSSGMLFKRALPLAPLQTPYVPEQEKNRLSLFGESTNSENALGAPFAAKAKGKQKKTGGFSVPHRSNVPHRSGLGSGNGGHQPPPRPQTSVDFVD